MCLLTSSQLEIQISLYNFLKYWPPYCKHWPENIQWTQTSGLSQVNVQDQVSLMSFVFCQFRL